MTALLKRPSGDSYMYITLGYVLILALGWSNAVIIILCVGAGLLLRALGYQIKTHPGPLIAVVRTLEKLGYLSMATISPSF